MDREGERAQALPEARPRSRHDDVVDGSDRAGRHRRHAVPAGACSDRFRSDALRGVAEEDDLGIGRDEALERDLEAGRAAGGDRLAAGKLDHFGEE